jgi:hypothetical protein
MLQWLKMIKGIYQTLHRKLKIAQHEPKTGDELICFGNLNRSLVLQNIKLGIGNTRPHTGKNPSHHSVVFGRFLLSFLAIVLSVFFDLQLLKYMKLVACDTKFNNE